MADETVGVVLEEMLRAGGLDPTEIAAAERSFDAAFRGVPPVLRLVLGACLGHLAQIGGIDNTRRYVEMVFATIAAAGRQAEPRTP